MENCPAEKKLASDRPRGAARRTLIMMYGGGSRGPALAGRKGEEGRREHTPHLAAPRLTAGPPPREGGE